MSYVLISLSNLSLSFADLVIFDDVSLSISQGESFALIGENGAGKTTLLHILQGTLTAGSGNIQRVKNLSITMLGQEITNYDDTITAREYIYEGPLSQLEKEISKLQEFLDDQLALTHWEKLHEEYQQKGGYNHPPVEEIIHGLKLSAELDIPMAQLSSGQKMRCALAKALFENPDLLLLDEPTNHLDRAMTTWLQSMIKSRKGATVIVSHDRSFLNSTCNRLIELHSGSLRCYGGSYDYYLEERKRILEKNLQLYKEQQKEMKELRIKLRSLTYSKASPRPPSDRNFMAYDRRGEHHQKSIQRTLNELKGRLDELEKNTMAHPRPKSITGLKFSSNPLHAHVAIRIEEASKRFDDKALFENCTLDICTKDRLVITGPNGSGKTTLIRCILGLEPLDTGDIHYTPSAKIAYLDQEIRMLPLDLTPLDYFTVQFSLSEEALRRELHMQELGGYNLLHKPFAKLSVGQRKRLMLLALILQKPNVLILDEPTNHLDLLTLEALEKALLAFDGAILAISHDETFIKKIATRVIPLE